MRSPWKVRNVVYITIVSLLKISIASVGDSGYLNNSVFFSLTLIFYMRQPGVLTAIRASCSGLESCGANCSSYYSFSKYSTFKVRVIPTQVNNQSKYIQKLEGEFLCCCCCFIRFVIFF